MIETEFLSIEKVLGIETGCKIFDLQFSSFCIVLLSTKTVLIIL